MPCSSRLSPRSARSRRGRTDLRGQLGLCVGLLSLFAIASSAAAQWRVVPELRVSGGEESDMVIDPGVTRTVVPGGAFLEASPAIAARRWVRRGGLLDLGTFATIQQFLNDDGRLIYAQTAWGDLFQSIGDDFRGRLSLAADFFDDSERDTVRRFGEGVEAGLALVRPAWNLELWGGVTGRQYPRFDVLDAGGETAMYTETSWSGGPTLRVSAAERVAIRCGASFQATSARDPYYDARSWTALGNVDARVLSAAFLTLSGTYQERDLTDRPPGEDHDSFWELGVGLRSVVAGPWTASVRYGYSNYTWPDESDADSHRLALAALYTWGERDAAPPPRLDALALEPNSGGSVRQPDAAESIRFRVRAMHATTVAIAGDFNAWDTAAAALRPAGDGWWEIDLQIAPGSYEYVYVIDGVSMTPPEATVTVEDGFGGRNGVLVILPRDL